MYLSCLLDKFACIHTTMGMLNIKVYHSRDEVPESVKAPYLAHQGPKLEALATLRHLTTALSIL